MNKLDTTFAALSDPTRRAIVQRLTRGPATVKELAGPFRMSQQAVSKHLVYLKRARLIQKRRHGRESICSLKPERIRDISEWADAFRRFWEEGFGRLDAALVEIKKLEEPHGHEP